MKNINEIISKYCKYSPLTTDIAAEYPDLCEIIVQHLPEIPFEVAKLLKYAKQSEELIREHESATQKGKGKPKRPPNSYFVFMAVFKELLSKLVRKDVNLDGKKRQILGAKFWKCLKDEYQEPYKRVAEIARKDFPPMTYERRRRGKTAFKPYDPESRSAKKKNQSPTKKKNESCTLLSISSNMNPTSQPIAGSTSSELLPDVNTVFPSGNNSMFPSAESNHIIPQLAIADGYFYYDNYYDLQVTNTEPVFYLQFNNSPADASQVLINTGYPPAEPSIVAYNGGVIPFENHQFELMSNIPLIITDSTYDSSGTWPDSTDDSSGTGPI